MRPAGASDATGIAAFAGDNRRKKYLGTLATLVAGVYWGGSGFGWFLWVETSKRQKVKKSKLWAAGLRGFIREDFCVMGPAAARDATGIAAFAGDNRRKKFGRTLASALAVMGWGGSGFWRFLVETG